MKHPALIRIALLKSASEGINTASAASAYGNATKSLMSGTTGKSTGAIRHPDTFDTDNPTDPDLRAEAADVGHPVSKSIRKQDEEILANLKGKTAALRGLRS